MCVLQSSSSSSLSSVALAFSGRPSRTGAGKRKYDEAGSDCSNSAQGSDMGDDDQEDSDAMHRHRRTGRGSVTVSVANTPATLKTEGPVREEACVGRGYSGRGCLSSLSALW